jgi:hypothetical protein
MGRGEGKIICCVMASALVLGLSACNGSNTGEVSDGYVEPESATYAQLPKSTAEKFTQADLVVGGVSYGASVEAVKAALGEPSSEDQMFSEANPDLVLTYQGTNGKTCLYFNDWGSGMALYGVECTDSERIFARGTHTGMKLEDVRDAFYRDEDSLNQNVMSEDGATILGKFLYGTTTIDRLEELKVTGGLEYGIINYNGEGSLEDGNMMLEYMYFIPPIKGQYVSYDDDFVQLVYHSDADGVITQINWYYYPEVNE